VLGQALGLTDAEFDALQGDYGESPLFDARERAVLAWSEAMTLNTAKDDDAVWNELRAHFNEAEIVEISLASAMFNMINRLNDSFRTELESEEYNRRQHRAVGVTRQALEDYACRICSSAAPGAT
jgi:alkylhydroperoxidase family enzyme